MRAFWLGPYDTYSWNAGYNDASRLKSGGFSAYLLRGCISPILAISSTYFSPLRQYDVARSHYPHMHLGFDKNPAKSIYRPNLGLLTIHPCHIAILDEFWTLLMSLKIAQYWTRTCGSCGYIFVTPPSMVEGDICRETLYKVDKSSMDIEPRMVIIFEHAFHPRLNTCLSRIHSWSPTKLHINYRCHNKKSNRIQVVYLSPGIKWFATLQNLWDNNLLREPRHKIITMEDQDVEKSINRTINSSINISVVV